MTEIHIQGLGTYVPSKRITNVDLMSLVDTSDEWIVSRTGIKARHMLADDENGSDAGTEAALRALEDAGIAAEDITHVLTATCTPDYLCPSTACIISGNIGSHGAMAFDLMCGLHRLRLRAGHGVRHPRRKARSQSPACGLGSLYAPPELGRPPRPASCSATAPRPPC